MVGYVRDVLLPKFEIQSCFVANGREEFLVMARCECGLPTFTVKMEEKERKQPYRLYTSMVVYFVLTSSLFGSVFAGEFMLIRSLQKTICQMITACLISFMIKCQFTSPFLLF